MTAPVLARRGMVATSQPLASGAGLMVLREGGNAADAAVAMAAALAVTEPCSTGAGGDCFALFFDARTLRVTALNGSGAAPAALTLGLLESQGLVPLPPLHAHTVTVPGACAGWCDLLARHGSRPLGELLAPAIRLAEAGFPVAPVTAAAWARSEKLLNRAPGGRALTLEGRAPRAGERFRNPGLARTLRAVAEGGKEAFYRGEIGSAVARAVQEAGGAMTAEDLARHASLWAEPISTTYRGVRIWECPPNGQGLAALEALNIVEGFELAGQDPLGPERLHLLIEALRLGFADAAWHAADPRFHEAPLADLLSKPYAAFRRKAIRPDRLSEAARGFPPAVGGTVYLCAVDGDGNAVSFINSNYQGFGTGIVPAGWGFSLQNRGLGFSMDPSHPNALAPGKRPYHTIIPGLLTREGDRSLLGPFGVMGGFMQPQGHLQVVAGLVDDGLDPQAALDRPRFCLRFPGEPDGIDLEAGIPEGTLEALARIGHTVRRGADTSRYGRGQVILRREDGGLCGGSDPRADGCASGF